MSKDLININLTIADRVYPLRIKPEEEETVRTAAKLIQQKVKDLSLLYEGKDKQDFLAMCALTYAVDLENIQINNQQSNLVIENRINEIYQLVDQAELR